MKKYFPIYNFSMKCALYPNKTQAKAIDDIIHALHVYHNNIINDMKENGLYLREKEDSKNPGQFIHYPDWTKAGGFEHGMKDTNFYKSYIEQDPRIGLVPVSALSNASKSIINDMQKALEKTGYHPVEQWGEKYRDENGNKVEKGIKYYNKAHPRRSFPTQISCSAVHRAAKKEKINGNIEYKEKIFFITIPKVGLVKVRGWNHNIKFDSDGNMSFLDYAEKNPKKQMSCTISKGTDDKYYISFSIINKKGKGKSAQLFPVAWNPRDVPEIRKNFEGVDVGEIDIAVLSDGTMYSNIFENCPKMKRYKDTLAYYDEKLSKMWGYKNENFVDALHESYETGKLLTPSNQYKKYELKRKKLYQKIVRYRKNFYHKVSLEIVTGTNVLGVESLKVTELFDKKKDKKENDPNQKTNKQRHHHNKNLSDIALSDFLSMLKYKAKLYETELIEIDQYFPSTKMCSNCGYVMDKIPTNIRKWNCPVCGTHHMRDVNAAINIKNETIKLYRIKNADLEKSA